MIRSYANIFVLLFFSWAVYSRCQQDLFLPIVLGSIIVIGFLLRLKKTNQFIFFEKIPLSVLIVLCYVVGMLYRSFVPAPENANAPFLDFISTAQSASLFAATLFALKPLTKNNIYRLAFCAFLTTCLSVNVPFTEQMLLTFAAFAFIGLSAVIINTMKRPSDPKYNFLYARDYIIFSILLTSMTAILFFIISWSIVVREQAFFNFMGNYIMPRHYSNFLNISPTLNLITPGGSAFDRRPVLEVSLPKKFSPYLRMQIFDRYFNGSWSEPKEITKNALPIHLLPNQPLGRITLFTPLKDLVPAPQHITATKSHLYFQSKDSILYTDNPQNTRIIDFSLSLNESPVNLSPQEIENYSSLPPSISVDLHNIAQSIVSDGDNAELKANKMVEYFHHNFTYSLNVSFSADNKGLLRMLKEKRPAYCTYFASALTLLLRSEGIPARVVTGFLTNEKSNEANNTYLARVRNAHAWTEALIPSHNSITGQTVYIWQTLDATPTSNYFPPIKKDAVFYLERLFERICLEILRFKAKTENMDKDFLKIYVILFLICVMIFINRKQILQSLKQTLSSKRVSRRITYTAPNELKIIYARYESYIKKEFNEIRMPSDTNADVIKRIELHLKANPTSIALIKTFINEYHAARFGRKDPEELKGLFDKLTKQL